MKSCKSCGRTFSGSHYCNSKNRTVRESELDNSGVLLGGNMFDGDLFD